MNLVFVGDRCCDHSRSSGYDQLCSLFPDTGWLSGRALESGRLEWHREPPGPDATGLRIFHVIYGDCSGKALPALLHRQFPRSVVISSLHQPISRLTADETAWTAVNASDALVTVSDEQARDLEGLGLTAPIYSIPHGVWTNAFRPASPWGIERTDVLLVGSFLRDWEGAKLVVAELARVGVRTVALGAGARDHLLGDGVPVEVLPRVSEETLADMYDRAAAVFLAFQAATASNALLEAMASGCPVVCPRLPSLVEECLGDDSDAFEPGRYDVAIARLLRYVRDPVARAEKSQELIARANRFDWSRLKSRFAAVYQEVAADRLVSHEHS